MAHIHDTHGHYEDSAAGTAFGFASGVMLAIIALVLAVVIAATVLLTTRPWNSSSSDNSPSVPNLPAQQGGGNGSSTGR